MSFDELRPMFRDYQSTVDDGAKVSQMRKAKFVKGESVMQFNDDYSETYKSVDLKKSSVNLHDFIEFLQNFTPDQGSDIRVLKFKKMQDIKKMLKFVPPIHHPFYLSLPHVNRRGETENNPEDFLPARRGED